MSDPLGRGWTSNRHRELNQKEAMDRLQSSLREAQEAAEEYHAAWQDAAVYWRHERDCWKETALLQERELITALRERDRFHSASQRYGQHEPECALKRDLTYKDALCTCGLVEARKAEGRG